MNKILITFSLLYFTKAANVCFSNDSYIHNHSNYESRLLFSIKQLNLHKNTMTISKRMYERPQLLCKKNCDLSDITYVQCNNTFKMSSKVFWKCDSPHLEKHVKIKPLKVICEGFNYPGDSFILNNSCQLIYKLEYVGYSKIRNITLILFSLYLCYIITYYDLSDCICLILVILLINVIYNIISCIISSIINNIIRNNCNSYDYDYLDSYDSIFSFDDDDDNYYCDTEVI